MPDRAGRGSRCPDRSGSVPPGSTDPMFSGIVMPPGNVTSAELRRTSVSSVRRTEWSVLGGVLDGRRRRRRRRHTPRGRGRGRRGGRRSGRASCEAPSGVHEPTRLASDARATRSAPLFSDNGRSVHLIGYRITCGHDRYTVDRRIARSQAYVDDRAHVFHSWSAQAALDPLVVAGAEGSRFWDDQGNSYLDFSSQLVNVNIGHQHPQARRRHQGAGRRAVHGRPVPRQRRPQRGGPPDRRAGARRPRHGVLHQRRRRGDRERHPHGPPAHRPPQGADDVPQLPRRRRPGRSR